MDKKNQFKREKRDKTISVSAATKKRIEKKAFEKGFSNRFMLGDYVEYISTDKVLINNKENIQLAYGHLKILEKKEEEKLATKELAKNNKVELYVFRRGKNGKLELIPMRLLKNRRSKWYEEIKTEWDTTVKKELKE